MRPRNWERTSLAATRRAAKLRPANRPVAVPAVVGGPTPKFAVRPYGGAVCPSDLGATRSPRAVATLTLGEEPDAWAAAGFTVDADGTCRVGSVRLVLAGPSTGHGFVAWALRGLDAAPRRGLDGFPTEATDAGPVEPAPHPNTARSVDHVVLMTDDVVRTAAAADDMGLAIARWRDHALPDGTPLRQAFSRVGDVVLELVGPAERPASPRPGVRSFGLAVTVADLETAADVLGAHLGPTRAAVQRGRLIATVRHRSLGLSTPLALMSGPPGRTDGPQ